jgi:hypothetical protein
MSDLPYTVKIAEKAWLTQDVIRFRLEKPDGYNYQAGQAIELTINEPGFINDAAPFTLTSLSTEEQLEIIFKVYPAHRGMTWGLSRLVPGKELLIGDAWDSFVYRKPGVFIAGGTGVTPFIAILRHLKAKGKLKGHQLYFANKTGNDIFLEKELSALLGRNYINILSRQRCDIYSFGHIDRTFLQRQHFRSDQCFYICGPGGFSASVESALMALGIKQTSIITEY